MGMKEILWVLLFEGKIYWMCIVRILMDGGWLVSRGQISSHGGKGIRLRLYDTTYRI